MATVTETPAAGGQEQFYYDGSGQRVAKLIANGPAGTSIASKVLGGINIGKSVPTPVGTPVTVSFAWRASANLDRIAGRYLPYVGIAVGAAATYGCLGSKP